MVYFVVCLFALLASALTFFSGFGLGTLLMPVLAIFFPVEIAIAITAVVHFLNNVFKSFLVGRNIHKQMLLTFGIPAFLFSILGAFLLQGVSNLPSVYEHDLWGKHLVITPIKLSAGILMIFFALFDLIPSWSGIQIDRKYTILGGALSGFFGGFSGHQGAFRSAFLIRSGISKEQFIATGIIIAMLVDISRIGTYFFHIRKHVDSLSIPLIAAATLSAFTGAYLGNKLIKKITLKAVQYIVGIMLMLIGLLLVIGII